MAGPYRYCIGPVVQQSLGGVSFYAPPESCVSWIDLRRIGEQLALGQLGCGFFAMPSGWTVPSGYTWLGGGEGDCRALYLSPSDQSAWGSLIGVRPTRTASTTVMDALDETLTDLADPTGESATKPLVPGALSGPPAEAEIILGGHSVVRRKQVPASGRWWNNLVSLAKRDVQEIIDRDPHDKLWRKYVGSLSLKYFGRWDDVRGNDLIPDAAKKNRAPSHGNGNPADRRWALRPETTHTESFDGADSGTLGIDLSWTEVSGTWDNASNRAKELSAVYNFRFARAEHDVSSSDHYAQADLTRCEDGANNHYAAVCARFSSSATTCYHFGPQRYYSPDRQYLSKFVAGTMTQLSYYSGDVTLTAALKCECEGSSIKGNTATVERVSLTDTAISSGTRGGLSTYRDLMSDFIEFDNYEIADLAAAIANPVLFHAHYMSQGMRP